MRNMLVLVFVAGCAEEPVWQEDPCGRRDPVEQDCSDTDVDKIEVGTDPTCADEGFVAGAACEPEGATCIRLRPLVCEDDPSTVVASDEVLTCGTEPPDALCPESRREVKQDIAYLDEAARRKLAQDALDVKLATYTYKDPAKGAGPQLGFILDDSPEAAFSGDERVNLYAYTSAVLAAVQEQQAEIDRLRARVEELEARDCAP
jgi:hypothetical protein